MSTSGIMQNLNIILKCIQAVLIYSMLKEGVPMAMSNGTWENRSDNYIWISYRDHIRGQ